MRGKSLDRGAGILLSITSLPSDYGIGTLGDAARGFIDLLVDMKQRYWQVLPIGPTSFGDSPYQPDSAFAGNPYLIDLDSLCMEGLLKKEEIRSYDWGNSGSEIDYASLYKNRYAILKLAYKRFDCDNVDFLQFCSENTYWLDDYALFKTIKKQYTDKSWIQWPLEYKDRISGALEEFRVSKADEMNFYRFCQYIFYRQWVELKKYANARGIQIIGDIPLYVAHDSSDVWAHREYFALKSSGEPRLVSAVPPDEFSGKGQIWGSPVYNWMSQEPDNYEWWCKRIEFASKLFDAIRLDHFIGMVKYYAVAPTSATSDFGRWYKGPGKKLLDAIGQVQGELSIIADDAGPKTIVPGVKKLVEKKEYSSSRILLMAFNTDAANDNLPHNYATSNIVIYPSTHDNETLVGFVENKSDEELEYLMEYLGVRDRRDIPDALIRLAYSSSADICIVQMQDLLMLGNEARMNAPSTVGNNWQWRVGSEKLSKERMDLIRRLAYIYHR